MKEKQMNKELVRKVALIGLLTAIATALGFIKIPILGVSITLVLPVIVIGAALCGPIVGAWLTVIPNLLAFPDSGIFVTNSPAGCIVTLLVKGLLAGLAAGFVYKLLSGKHPIGAVAVSAVVAPIINTAIFLFGCYIFIWNDLVAKAQAAGIGVGTLVLLLGVINGTIELILNVVLCPSIFRIIELAKNKFGRKE